MLRCSQTNNLTSPSLGLAAARNAFSVSLRTKKDPRRARCLGIRPSQVLAAARGVFPLFPHPDRAANKSAVPKNTTICGLRTSWKRVPDLAPSQQGTPSWCLSRAKKSLSAVVGTKKPSRPLQAPCKAPSP